MIIRFAELHHASSKLFEPVSSAGSLLPNVKQCLVHESNVMYDQLQISTGSCLVFHALTFIFAQYSYFVITK